MNGIGPPSAIVPEASSRRPPRLAPRLLIAACLLIWPAGRAWAQDTGDADAGKGLAEKWCGACHVVGTSQQAGSSNGAPPFAAIAAMPWATPMGLRVFLQSPHGRMPDLHLTRDEIANVSAYIVSLKKP